MESVEEMPKGSHNVHPNNQSRTESEVAIAPCIMLHL